MDSGRYYGFFLSFAGCTASQRELPPEHTAGLFAMGTYMNFTAYGEQAQSALEEAADYVEEWESLWSAIDEQSEIYAVNHSNGEAVQLSRETEELLRFTLNMARETDGALDPTIYPLVNAWGFINQEYRVPSQQEIAQLLAFTGYEKVRLEDHRVSLPEGVQLDLGAVGKGYTGELLAAYLKE